MIEVIISDCYNKGHLRTLKMASISHQSYSFLPLVLMPNGRYKGHILIKPVRMKIADNTSKMIATIPLMTFVKYNAIIMAAINIRIIRSAVPMFFFIKQ